METLKKKLEKGKENTKQQMSNSSLEAETQESKLNTEISLFQRKEESLSRFRAIQEADTVTLEKRLDVKNQLMLDLEQNIRKLTLKVSELQDTII